MSYQQPNYADNQSAADKTNMPGIFLMIVGVLNLLGAFGLLFLGIMAVRIPEAEFARQPTSQTALQQGWTPGQLKSMGIAFYLISGGAALIAAIITILAGLKMRALQSYALVLTGSLLALIPCLSPAGCCGLGEGIGIWALIVLMSPEVKAAFR